MTKMAMRSLSSEELDTVSGGKDDVVVCVRTDKASFLGVTFNWASCANGDNIFYITTD